MTECVTRVKAYFDVTATLQTGVIVTMPARPRGRIVEESKAAALDRADRLREDELEYHRRELAELRSDRARTEGMLRECQREIGRLRSLAWRVE